MREARSSKFFNRRVERVHGLRPYGSEHPAPVIASISRGGKPYALPDEMTVGRYWQTQTIQRNSRAFAVAAFHAMASNSLCVIEPSLLTVKFGA
jgi:hypothetical protein